MASFVALTYTVSNPRPGGDDVAVFADGGT
jgi:hypothetical protein